MANFFTRLFSSKAQPEPLPPPEPGPEPLTPEQVREQLAPFGLAESELDHLSGIISTGPALERMLGSLKAHRTNMLEKQLGELSSRWRAGEADHRLLLACQHLLGMGLVHPIFEPAAGLLNLCDGFGALLPKLLSPQPINRHFSIYFAPDQELTVRMFEYSDGRLSFNPARESTFKLPWSVAYYQGERDFWIGFARKMIEKILAGEHPRRDNVQCVADAAGFATFASLIASHASTEASCAKGEEISAAHSLVNPS